MQGMKGAVALGFALLPAALAAGAEYPSKPVRLVVPYATALLSFIISHSSFII